MTSLAETASLATRIAPGTFEHVYDEHLAFVWRNAQRLLGLESHVDDVVQEVFIIAHRRLSEFEGRSSVRTWLYGILRNVVHDFRRANHRRGVRDSIDLETIESTGTGPQRSAENWEARRALYELLGTIEEKRREIFILAEIEQVPPSEIADILGLKRSTVHGRLRDARRDFEAAVARFQARRGVTR